MTEERLKGWNHLPDIPLKVSPLFVWPIRPFEVLKWVWNSWFLISERLIIVGITFACYLWLKPPLEAATTFAFGWIAQIYVLNFMLTLLVAGLLHMWFYTSKSVV